MGPEAERKRERLVLAKRFWYLRWTGEKADLKTTYEVGLNNRKGSMQWVFWALSSAFFCWANRSPSKDLSIRP
jgi:hypothetical protein